MKSPRLLIALLVAVALFAIATVLGQARQIRDLRAQLLNGQDPFSPKQFLISLSILIEY